MSIETIQLYTVAETQKILNDAVQLIRTLPNGPNRDALIFLMHVTRFASTSEVVRWMERNSSPGENR